MIVLLEIDENGKPRTSLMSVFTGSLWDSYEAAVKAANDFSDEHHKYGVFELTVIWPCPI